MIKLKNKVNKSAIMRELHNEAVEMYKNAYEREYAIEQFLYGAEKLFEKLRQCDVGRCNFSEHYGEFWAVVENLVDENGWVYVKEAPHLLDVVFENATEEEIDYQKSFSFLSGDNPNWLTRGARWRPKSISLLHKG